MILVGSTQKLLAEQTAARHTIVITDQNIAKLYAHILAPYEVITFQAGEENKTLQTVQTIHRSLLAKNADRSTLIVGMGGGLVSDVAGFVGSTYMRGVDFGFVATTLLSQVDAAIGGKNGVNLDGYKNIIGTFTLPKFVIADPEFLRTLPPREVQSGMGEVIKYGLLEDPEILEMTDMSEIIRRSMLIKERIVQADFREGGVRKLLNLGHTYGHAIEKATSGKYSHGQAVAVGMAIAAKMSVDLGFMAPSEYHKILSYIEKAGLPTRCAEVSFDKLTELIRTDKKRKGNSLDMILLKGIGKPFIHTIEL